MVFWSTLVGALLLVLLCVSDYRNRVKRTTSRPLYSLAMLLFLIFNLSIYLLLVMAFVGSPDVRSWMEGSKFPTSDALIPVLVAMLYFGAGAATIRVFGTEFSLYNKLIEAFIQLFRFVIDSADVRSAIIESKDEYKKYRESLEALHEEAGFRGWDTLAEEWKEIRDETVFVEEHIDDLESMSESLEADQSAGSISNIREKIENRAIELRERLIQRLKYHLYGFILKNAKTKDDVRHMLEGLPDAFERIQSKIEVPDDRPREEWRLIHSALVGGFFGFFVGLVVLLGPTTNPLTPWIAAVACALFMVIFHFAMEVRDPVAAGALGGLAGWSGYMLWGLLGGLTKIAGKADETLPQVGSSGPYTDAVKETLSRTALGSLEGVLYGAASGLLLFLFRRFVCARVERCLPRILLVAGIGAAAFAAVAAVVQFLPGRTSADWQALLRMAVIGAVFFVGIAHASRLLQPTETA